jgi:hypothetical protein
MGPVGPSKEATPRALALWTLDPDPNARAVDISKATLLKSLCIDGHWKLHSKMTCGDTLHPHTALQMRPRNQRQP